MFRTQLCDLLKFIVKFLGSPFVYTSSARASLLAASPREELLIFASHSSHFMQSGMRSSWQPCCLTQNIAISGLSTLLSVVNSMGLYYFDAL
ncbi:hypothetical protein JTE90_000193 [Oedothorax gibbosus]|uniref:Uncharacterized protein n=1 Tax=Oedothorax gibbosus TaxID=931172 RepID=A0AAV6TEY4_9ARAC|nr:hypothetical protein JTE90_000193 [Oedothorax gibbosus]